MLITRTQQLNYIAEAVATATTAGEWVSLDVAATANPRLVGIATTNEVWVLDLFQLRAVGPLAEALSRTRLVSWCVHRTFKAQPLRDVRPHHVFDVQLASVLLGGGTHRWDDPHHSVEEIAARALDGLHLPGQVAGIGAAKAPVRLVQAASDRARGLLRLRPVLQGLLEASGMAKAARVDMALLPVVLAMTDVGVGIDLTLWRALLDARQTRATALAEGLHRVLRSRGRRVDLANDESLQEALAGFGIEVNKVSRMTLSPFMDKNLVKVLVEYRSVRSFIDSYGRALGHQRVHPAWVPTHAGTGRMQALNPAITGLPHTEEVRRCVIPRAGCVFINADYKAIELRVAAQVAGDENLRRVFERRDDPHAATAAAMLGKVVGEVTQAERAAAKAVNFGVLFGMGASTLSVSAQEKLALPMTVYQADQYIAAFRIAYPKVAAWQDGMMRAAPAEVRTQLGRLRRVDKWTQRINTPIQGTASEGMKLALIRLFQVLPQGASIVLAAHDEVLVECPRDLADEALLITETSMVEAMQVVVPDVPVEVAANIKSTWWS